jgi:hypothetical protein
MKVARLPGELRKLVCLEPVTHLTHNVAPLCRRSKRLQQALESWFICGGAFKSGVSKKYFTSL